LTFRRADQIFRLPSRFCDIFVFFLARQNSPKNQALQKLLFGTILLISGMSSVNFFSIFVNFGSLPGLFWQVFSGFNFDIEFQAFLDAKNLKTKNEKVAPDT